MRKCLSANLVILNSYRTAALAFTSRPTRTQWSPLSSLSSSSTTSTTTNMPLPPAASHPKPGSHAADSTSLPTSSSPATTATKSSPSCPHPRPRPRPRRNPSPRPAGLRRPVANTTCYTRPGSPVTLWGSAGACDLLPSLPEVRYAKGRYIRVTNFWS